MILVSTGGKSIIEISDMNEIEFNKIENVDDLLNLFNILYYNYSSYFLQLIK